MDMFIFTNLQGFRFLTPLCRLLPSFLPSCSPVGGTGLASENRGADSPPPTFLEHCARNYGRTKTSESQVHVLWAGWGGETDT